MGKPLLFPCPRGAQPLPKRAARRVQRSVVLSCCLHVQGRLTRRRSAAERASFSVCVCVPSPDGETPALLCGQVAHGVVGGRTSGGYSMRVIPTRATNRQRRRLDHAKEAACRFWEECAQGPTQCASPRGHGPSACPLRSQGAGREKR